MTRADQRDVILGFGFGEVVSDGLGILVSMLVRAEVNGKMQEGVRDPVVIDSTVLEALRQSLPMILETLREKGLDNDAIPPAARPIPWNEGVTLAQTSYIAICTMFALYEIGEGQPAAIARIEVGSGQADDAVGADYLMPYRTLVELADAVPKVLARMKNPVPQPVQSALDFDFAQLNFKWDPKLRKVKMNRGYLSEFLRANGVTTLPGMQDLMDLMANLYLLHRKKGRPAIPPMEAFLAASGMTIKEHDPATITPARRQMDNMMDTILLAARTVAREQSATEFWRWLDAEIAPVESYARENGEGAEFEARYVEVLQLAKDAGFARSQ